MGAVSHRLLAAGFLVDRGLPAALQRVDAFLKGLLEQMASDTLLLVTSDHGNIEDVRSGHTRNPALGIASGPGEEHAPEMSDLRHVTPFVLRALGIE